MPYIYVDIILHLCIHMVSYLKVVKNRADALK